MIQIGVHLRAFPLGGGEVGAACVRMRPKIFPQETMGAQMFGDVADRFQGSGAMLQDLEDTGSVPLLLQGELSGLNLEYLHLGTPPLEPPHPEAEMFRRHIHEGQPPKMRPMPNEPPRHRGDARSVLEDINPTGQMSGDKPK